MSKQVLHPRRNKIAHPIPSMGDIDRIRKAIGSCTRDLLLFHMAIETGVAANQLLALKIKDLDGVAVGEEIIGLRGKQGRVDPVVMGPRTRETFKRHLKETHSSPEDPLFKSRKGGASISLPSASRLVKGWFDKVGIEGMSGFLSLRKTWELLHGQPDRPSKPRHEASPPETPYQVNTIQPQTTQELVYKELERAIVTARIKPGERLITEELARQMGISRIPVREAIGRLEARNFLTVQPKKGTIVNELSERNLNEILEIRLMLECCAAKKAAISASKNMVEQLKQLNKKYIVAQKENNPDETLSVNREFHFTIYRSSHMPILMDMIQNLWDQISPYSHLMFRQTVFHDPKTGHTYHQHIIDGIAANDPEKVSKWLATDLSESTDFVINLMRSMQSKNNR